MVRKLPPLNALKAFESAARHASFSLAADELSVTHAAISRHIRELEAKLRAKLFVRTGRGVRLTESGEALAANLTQAFDLMATATDRFARPSRRRQRLTVSCDVSFAAIWLLPRLGRFTSQHPAIDLVIDPNCRLIDFDKEDVDLGVRFGAGGWRDVEAVKLVDSNLRVVCAPARVARQTLRSPADLPAAALIQESPAGCWQTWLAAAGVADSVVPAGPTVNGDLAIAAAQAGQGFALADQVQAGDALLAGRLVSPFDIVVRRQAYYVVRSARSPIAKPAKDFQVWLMAEMAAMSDALSKKAPSKSPSRRPPPQPKKS